MARPRTSEKAGRFTESVIREMTRLAHRHGAVNLAQGFPDFPAPEAVKAAACEAIRADINQYAVTWGAKALREAIAADAMRRHGLAVDPDRHVTVCCGATEAMMATMMAIVDPGDEVIVFEPFYENYGPDAILSGATPRYVRLYPPAGTGPPGGQAASASEPPARNPPQRAGALGAPAERGVGVTANANERSGASGPQRASELGGVQGSPPSRQDRVGAAVGAEPPGQNWTFDADELAGAFSNRTRAVIINTPNNPTGKVFTREELEQIARLCRHWGAVAVTDEIYEHIVCGDHAHVPMATLDGMADATVTINSVSKTFSVTGWRVGWAVAPADITGAIRKVHDFLTVGAAAPLQAAAAAALALPASYFAGLSAMYQQKRDRLLQILRDAGFVCFEPHGAYYVMTDISGFGFEDDVSFARHLVMDVGIASVPGSSFYRDAASGRTKVRFCYCKKDETLAAAEERFAAVRHLSTRGAPGPWTRSI